MRDDGVRVEEGRSGDPSEAVAVLLGFARALRAAGADASAERVHAFLRAVDALRPGVRTDVYWAGRLTLCAGPDDLERYDRVFAAYFGTGGPGGPPPPAASRPRRRLGGGGAAGRRAGR
ncbi:hypothetical protein ACFVIN_30150, partial [Streptomyces prasinus]